MQHRGAVGGAGWACVCFDRDEPEQPIQIVAGGRQDDPMVVGPQQSVSSNCRSRNAAATSSETQTSLTGLARATVHRRKS
jgi:hypothetical protein